MPEVMFGGIVVDTSQFDFNDRSSNVGAVLTANATLIALVGAFVTARIAVRVLMVRKMFLDDFLIIIASAFTIALAAVSTGRGLGTHIFLLPPQHIFDLVKSCIQLLYVCQVLYACAIASTKIAIIASYLRFVQDRKFRISMHVTAGLIIGLWLTGIFVTIFQCRPVSGAWDFTEPRRRCIDFVNYLYVSSSISVVTDIILCAMPCPYLWKLNMPLKQRIILCVLFGGGAGACIAGILRISKLHTLRSMDVTYQCVTCLNLSIIECSLGIICVSIPPLRPLAVKLFPAILRTDRSASSRSPLQSLNYQRRNNNNNNNKQRSGTRLDNITIEEDFTLEESTISVSERKETTSLSQKV
ncbi:hypothetical protein BU24DRAFT_352711 [Aaosphaeria arxii CBS 175.79]|uniref:Rhodopsin domain-containing protein n=1 Tax=Aaosphaeria arxii CBS 175.79 TaxID=1450172 RepID=A0A6A5XFD3_9PLEO|nr:uncharacterized protein BU24DRAFT_352711 [Aaosphaeria arxii CBS 175.79]KAF2011955.1 hypothetical protein BU24DRAFT_352711 [Aaosphaeria arxii CBS 175.79]